MKEGRSGGALDPTPAAPLGTLAVLAAKATTGAIAIIAIVQGQLSSVVRGM